MTEIQVLNNSTKAHLFLFIGNYTCRASPFASATIAVHVLNGKFAVLLYDGVRPDFLIMNVSERVHKCVWSIQIPHRPLRANAITP